MINNLTQASKDYSPEELSNLIQDQINQHEATRRKVQELQGGEVNDTAPIPGDLPAQQAAVRQEDARHQQSLSPNVSGIGETGGSADTGYAPEKENTYHAF